MQKVTLAGRTFKPVVNSTLEHDIAACEMLQRMGLSNLGAREGESEAAFRDRLMVSLVKSEELLPLLGHLLQPVKASGAEWTPAMAMETAAFFGGLNTPGDKAKLLELILEVLLFFCAAAVGSMLTSQKSSSPAASALNLFRNAARASMATGDMSFAT